MKNRIEVSKNAEGRVEEGFVTDRGKKIRFINEWDDDGFLRARSYEGIRANLPSAVDMIRSIDQEYIERIRRIDQIDEIVNIQKIDEVHVANATVQNIVQGFNFTERWERGYFNRTKFFGRTEPFYMSEAEEPPPYAVPTMVKNINTIQPTPWNNAIWMRNSKDGTIQDEIYFGIPLAFNRAVLRIDALLPTVAQIAAADDLVAWGFECCSQGGTTAVYVFGGNGAYTLNANYQGPVGGGIYSSVAVVFPNTNAWSTYWLELNPPIIRLFEYDGATWTVLGTLVLTEPSNGEFWMCPFFCNESATNIVTNFYIGNISVWKLEGRALPGHADSAVNTILTATFETMNARELVLRFSTTAAAFVGKAQVSISSDNVNWDIVEDITLPAFTHYLKAYDDNHYCALAEHLHNPCIWPFIKVTMDAQGAGKIGTLQWALK